MGTYTQNISLFKRDPATEGSERFSISELLNGNSDKIDAAFGGLLTRMTAAEAKQALPGMYIYSGSYTGTGADISRKISTTKKPYLVVINKSDGEANLKCWRPCTATECINSSYGTYQQTNQLTWASDGVTIAQTFHVPSSNGGGYGDMFNQTGVTYTWIAFCAEA